RWNKDAHHLYIWNSLHGVAHGIDASQLLYSSQRHDFVPSYVRRHWFFSINPYSGGVMFEGRRKLMIAFLVFVFIPALFFSCSSPTQPEAGSKGIIPLSKGNAWTYNGYSYDASGGIIDSSSYTDSIDYDTLMYGQHLYSYPFLGNVTNTDTGLIVLVGIFGSKPAYAYEYQYPTTSTTLYYCEAGYQHVISMDTLIVVPAGTFHCIHYRRWRYPTNDTLEDAYICPGVGIVKDIGRDFKFYPGSPVAAWTKVELTKYQLR
ncbi:MAG: hypothetical protein M1303_09565, partial [Bacteroidetes bacterium]|nr:hypothetical protein [Bacteroidota bacterium]